MKEKLTKIRKRIPLTTRLRVDFEAEWLNMNINPDRPATEDELVKAEDWADKMVKWVMADIKQWEEDGSPGRT